MNKENPFLPYVLRETFEDKLVSFTNCPEFLDIEGSTFLEVLKKFKSESDKKLLEIVLKTSSDLVARGKSLREVRNIRSEVWWTEFYMSIYNVGGGEPFVAELNIGDVASASTVFKRYEEPHTSKKKIHIHSHPSGQTLSGPDIMAIFAGISPEKYCGDVWCVLPPITILPVCTDNGYYLTFVTNDSKSPSKRFAEDRAMLFSGKFGRKLTGVVSDTWSDLKEKYGSKVNCFMGEKLDNSYVSFPPEVNQMGVELINLQYTLDICKKLKMPLYFMPHGESVFTRVNLVEDLFPELL